MAATVVKQLSAVPEDSGFYYMARITGQDGAAITQASLSSIVLTVRDKADPATEIGASPYTLTVSSVVYDTLQTTSDDARWTVDTTGYNFGYATLAAQVPTGAKTYRFEFKFTPASGEVFYDLFDVPTIDLLGS